MYVQFVLYLYMHWFCRPDFEKGLYNYMRCVLNRPEVIPCGWRDVKIRFLILLCLQLTGASGSDRDVVQHRSGHCHRLHDRAVWLLLRHHALRQGHTFLSPTYNNPWITRNYVFPKYRGITFDGKLSRKCYVDAVVRKVHSRLHCLRKLRFLNWCQWRNLTAVLFSD